MSTNPYFNTTARGVGGRGKRVVVAMSGGVDSSVAAALLKEQGYDVIGIALQVTDYSKYRNDQGGGNCCSIKDMEDARRVATKVDIPFYVLDTEKAFDSTVVNYFINDYLSGRTPNPCVMCNTRVKFNHLYKKAMDLGADFIATGHYAKISQVPDLGYCLEKGDDPRKDQSYFLFNLNQEQLKRTLFPVGGLTKDKVREIAARWNLPVSSKPDSQEICFVPANDYSKFIKGRVAPQFRPRGYFVDTEGHVLGEHEGVFQYTVGQRKGLQVAAENAKRLGYAVPEPMYVVRIDPTRSHVVVGGEDDLSQPALVANHVHWIVPPDLLKERTLTAKIRYSAEPADCVVEQLGGDRVTVKFSKKLRAITPGQAIVFYQGSMVLGGGWIENALHLNETEIPKIAKAGIPTLQTS